MLSLELQITKIFILLCFCSGVIALGSGFFDFDILRLWKELIAVVMISLSFFIYNKISLHKAILLLIPFLFMVLNAAVTDNIHGVLYQVKLDIVLFVFTVAIYYLFKGMPLVRLEWFLHVTVKLVIVLGFLNAMAAIAQAIFFKEFLELIGITFGNWGTHSGLKIITTFGELRAPGVMTGFVQSGTISLLAWVLYLHYHKELFKLSSATGILVNFVFLYGIWSSTYKTAILGVMLVLLFFMVDKLKLRSREIFFMAVGLIFFAFFFSASISYWFYDVVAKFNESIAYNSIYVRVFLHHEVFAQVNSVSDLLFGVGYGLHGTFGVKDRVGAIPLDSTFIYVFSNYGLLGVIFFVGGIWRLAGMLRHRRYQFRPVYFYLLYIFAFEFFFNNVIANFPLNYIFSLLVVLTFLYRTHLLRLPVNDHSFGVRPVPLCR